MSLAMFAAPFDDNNDLLNTNNDNNIINKKRRTHNRTQKMYSKENFDTNKVNNILNKIHNNDVDDDENDKYTFHPPPKTESVGVQRTKITDNNSSSQQKEEMTNMETINEYVFKTLGRSPHPNYTNADNLDLNDYRNYGDSKTNDEYYRNILPNYETQIQQNNFRKQPNYQGQEQRQRQGQEQRQSYQTEDSILLQKLNYMINLLEDQQDEKTSNVTEEVVLYFFLGIFIIFIADTFVRAGKYVR